MNNTDKNIKVDPIKKMVIKLPKALYQYPIVSRDSRIF